MSNLKKAIERSGRREGGQMGFAHVSQAKRKAMLLAAIVEDGAAVTAAAEAGADVALISANDATGAVRELGKASGVKIPVGALLPSLDKAGADALADAKCDFVMSPLGTTRAGALEPGRMGHVISLGETIDDASLRALGPLGLDAIAVPGRDSALFLEDQLGFVRVAQLSATPLLVRLAAEPDAAELRALRDSGAAIVVAKPGTNAAGLRRLAELLREVPEPRRREGRGPEVALLPALLGGGHDHDDEDDEPDDD
jgi:hypothetical protein